MDATFAALADPSRRAIIGLLAERDRSVNELLEHFSFSQPALSRHLRLLREAGLVLVEPDGRFRRYRLAGRALGEAATWLLRYERFWNERLDTLGKVLDRAAETSKRPRRGS